MDSELAQLAISAALTGDWTAAVDANNQILQNDPTDIEALNRVARAYCELGKITKARQISKKVLKLEPFNPIATKSLKKWEDLGDGELVKASLSKPHAFLEEPGKTKVVTLINLGEDKLIANLDCGDIVTLSPHAHTASVTTGDGKYIGKLPDNLSARIIDLIKKGIVYETIIKSVDEKNVKVFIRQLTDNDDIGASFV